VGGARFVLLGKRFVAHGRFIAWERAYYLAADGGWVARDIVRHPGSTAVVLWDGHRVHQLGLYPGRLSLLHVGYTSPGFADELTWIYLGEDLTRGTATPQGPEEAAAEVVSLTAEEAALALESGQLRDAKTILGLCSLLRRLGR
jgi:hypothetical protein